MSSRRSVIVLVVLLIVLGAAVLSAAIALRSSAPAALSPSVLVWQVPYVLEESSPPADAWSVEAFRPERPTVWDVVRTIDRAGRDGSVSALVVHLDGIGWGWGKVAEVRDALLRFRASGKPLYVSLPQGGEREYFLASAADRIAVPPLGILQLDGLTASALFWRGTYDKLDIRPNFASVGTYKSAVEAYTRTGMSDASREVLGGMLDDHLAVLADTIASARGMSADSVRARIERGPYEAAAAVAMGFADTVLHAEDLDSLAVRAGGRRHRALSFARYLDRDRSSTGGAAVALIPASGALVEGRSRSTPFGEPTLGSQTLIEALRDAARRPSVRAVVLRIDSPGGSAPAAEAVWHEVDRVRRLKPVVVSMSDLAASGGYYIAAGASSIVAQPNTLTGSIGVYGGKLNVLGLYRKLGLNVETVARGPRAEMMSPYKDFSDEERGLYEAQLGTIYRTFVGRVAAGRAMSSEAVDSVGQGRVWTGRRALALGLVDELGGVDRAIAIARDLAGLDPDDAPEVEIYPRVRRTFLQNVFSDLFLDPEESALARLFLPEPVRAHLVLEMLAPGEPLARMPYTIEIR